MGSWDRTSAEGREVPAAGDRRDIGRRADRGPEPQVGEGWSRRGEGAELRQTVDRGEPRIDETERVLLRGVVDSSGHSTDGRDLDYTATSTEAFDHLRRGEAPLGMSPERYGEMKAELEVALERDGLDDADVRLQGSAAFFYSRNPNKEFFSSAEVIRDHCAERRANGFDVGADTEDAAVQRWEGFGYGEGPGPRDKMFDQDYMVTGLPEDRSDYDIQISSDTLQAEMEQYQREHPDDRLISDHGGHWKSDPMQDRFRSLQAWATTWTERTGREVNLAGFPGDGPTGESRFSDDDWIIRQHQS